MDDQEKAQLRSALNHYANQALSVGVPLSSRFAEPTPQIVASVRDKWTSDRKYLVNGEPRFWNWYMSYVKRLRNPSIKISIKRDTEKWLGGSKPKLFELIRDLGYTGPTVFRPKSRLLTNENATKLYNLMIDENASDTREEVLEAGTSVGVMGATAQIARGLTQDKEALLIQVQKLRDEMIKTQDRETQYRLRSEALEEENMRLKGMLETCERNTERHKQELKDYAKRELEEDQPPPPPPYDLPEDQDYEDGVPPPPPPPPILPNNEGGGGGFDRVVSVLEARIEQIPRKAVNNGLALGSALQDEIKKGITLVSPSARDKDQPVDGTVKQETQQGLFGALQSALARRRGAFDPTENEEEEEEPSAFVTTDMSLVDTCLWCGKTAYVTCACGVASYCNQGCKDNDNTSHAFVCTSMDRSVFVSKGGVFTVFVASKDRRDYVGRYPEQGSPNAYRVLSLTGDIMFGETLILDDNTDYTFRSVDDMRIHPMYISSEAKGGTTTFENRIIPGVLTARGTTFTFNTSNLPDVSYAVCDNHPYMGFEIQIQRA